MIISKLEATVVANWEYTAARSREVSRHFWPQGVFGFGILRTDGAACSRSFSQAYLDKVSFLSTIMTSIQF
jgi:hypothetical protein